MPAPTISCDPQDLVSAAKCFRCIPPGFEASIITRLLCGWLQNVSPPPVTGFAYTPATAIINWDDAGGNHSGNLAFFNATADKATTTDVDLGGQGLTAVTDIQDLTALQNLILDNNNSLATIDVSGMTWLVTLSCVGTSALVTLNVTGCTGLTALDCSQSTAPMTAITGLQTCTAMQNLKCYINNLTSLNVTGLTALTYLDCSSNQLTAITGLSTCTALTTFFAFTNLFAALDLTFMPTTVAFIDTSDNPNLVSINMSQILHASSEIYMDISPNLTSVNLSSLLTCHSLTGSNCTSLPSLSLPALTSVDIFGFGACSAMTTFTAPNLTTIGDYFDLSLAAVVTLSLPSLTSVANAFDCSGNTAMTTLSFAAGPAFGGILAANGNSALTSLNLAGSTFANAGQFVNFIGCALVVGDATHGIDGILARGVASGVTTLTFGLDLGTNAQPSACTDVNTLRTAGNTVNVNGPC